MTTYYVDAKSSLTVEDSLTGALTIKLADASFLSAGQDIFVGAESYTIESIDSNDITITSETTVDYTVDTFVRKDDTLLDGLTPANAKSSIFIAGSDNANTFEIWVKPDSIEYLEVDKPAQYSKITFWPKTADDFYFNERPQAGIDAGWDMVERVSHINMKDKMIDGSAVDDNKLEISNFSLNADEKESYPLFYLGGCVFTLNAANITSYRDGDQYSSSVARYLQQSYNIVTFNKCDINHEYGNLMSSVKGTELHDYSQTVNIIDSEIRVKMAYYRYVRGSKYAYGFTVNILRSSLIVDYIQYSYQYDCYSRHDSFLNITDSTISASYMVKPEGLNSSDYTSPRLTVVAKESSITVTNNVLEYTAGYQDHLYLDHEIIFENCEISCASLIYADYYNYQIRFNKPIRVTGCAITSRGSYLIHLVQVSSYKQIVLQGLRSLSCKGVIYANVTPDNPNLLILENANIGGNIVTTTGKSNITIHNSVIAGQGASGGSNVHTKAYGCSIQGENGVHTAEYRNCFISPSGTGFFGGGSFTISRECKFSDDIEFIAHGENTKAIVIDSELDVDLLKTPEFADVRIFNSLVKGVETPYADYLNAMVKKISPIYRVGGGNGSVYITPVLARKVYGTVEEVIGMVSSSAKTVRFYLASNGSFEQVSKLGAFSIQYVDVNGNRRMASLNLQEDPESNWDGLELDKNKFFLEYNIETTDMDKSKQVSLYASVGLRIEDVSEIWFDLDLGFTF